MPIDSSIYFQQQSPDIMGNIQKGLSMRDMLDQKKKQQGIDSAYQAGMVKNPDGSVSYDANKTMLGLSGVQGAGREAYEFSEKNKAEQANRLKSQQEEIAKSAWSITDQNTHSAELARLGKMGIDTSKINPKYDPSEIKRYQMMTMPIKERLDQENKLKDQDFKQQEIILREQELGIKSAESGEKNKKTSGAIEGRKTLDKEFAKDYNDWTSGGSSRAESEIGKIEGVISRLKDNKGTTGGLTGVFGDRLTSNDVLQNRADVQQSAMTLIKQLLSGATSDSDRKVIVDTIWNEADSTKNNVDRLERFVSDMKNRKQDVDAKSKYYEQNETLSGFHSVPTKSTGGDSQNLAQNKPSWAK